jgi:purine-nucleoside phosphorylase
VRIPCHEVPGFPVPTVAGHAGEFWAGRIGETPVLVQRGRAHYYEGLPLEDVTFATRLFALLGAETLVVTNASGAINPDLRAGDLVLITDHINMLGANPLRGPNLEGFGPRFPDMSAAYTPRLRALAKEVAGTLGIDVKEGVYVAALGPSYETPAEIRAFGRMGAALVGMSTVPEVIVAAHAGMQVLGISIATNLAAGVDPDATLTHEEVIETTARKGAEMRRLLLGILARL